MDIKQIGLQNMLKIMIEDEKYKKYNIKIISIICTKIEIKSRKNKVFTLFKEGIEKQRLFYPKQLCNFINKYFTS